MKFKTECALLIMTHVKLGDFLVMTPHLRAIQKLYPHTLIAIPDFLLSLYAEQKIFTRYIGLNEMKLYLDNYSYSILNLSFPLIPNLVTGPGQFRLGTDFFRQPQHVFKSYASALREYFPLMPLDTKQKPFLDLCTSNDVFEAWNVRPFEYFTLHSGSDFAPKNWDPENFENLAIRLLDNHSNLKCLSIVGPIDQPLFLSRAMPDRFVSVQSDIKTVAHLMASALFHVDSDSGVHHLAGAADVPSITVFGATGPGSWASLTEQNFIHWGAPNCPTPCEGSRMADCPDRVCISSVKVDHLLSSAESILAAYNHI